MDEDDSERLRFSLRSLLGVVAMAAVASAALVNGSIFWFAVTLALVCIVLGWSTYKAFALGPRRLLFVAFAIAGWAGVAWTLSGEVPIVGINILRSIYWSVARRESVFMHHGAAYSATFLLIERSIAALLVGMAALLAQRVVVWARRRRHIQP